MEESALKVLAYIGIGSNLGDPAENVRQAMLRLGTLGDVKVRSSLYLTAPQGEMNQPDFVNAVVALETALPVRQLLDALREQERRAGRQRDGRRWGPRTIDLDILTYGDCQLDEAELIVPHPRMHERAFVLVPLAEIAPSFCALRDALSREQLAGVRRL
jgi:2-amino-4-hydroxy-6-hydroxymethyldihydropteridine diphosphokinase